MIRDHACNSERKSATFRLNITNFLIALPRQSNLQYFLRPHNVLNNTLSCLLDYQIRILKQPAENIRLNIANRTVKKND
jgi:hypothetical protein